MKKIHPLWFGLTTALLFPAGALALDASAAIKVTPIVKGTASWNDKPVVYPQGQAEITGMMIEIAPGAETGWHGHPVPSFGVVLEGTLEVTLKDGRKKRVGPGEGLIEVVSTLHNGRNIGTVPVKLIVFYAGAVGKTLSYQPAQ